MTYQRNSINRQGPTVSFRTVLRVEALESRVLLAGLVNLSDNLLSAPQVKVDSDSAVVRQIEDQSLGTIRLENNPASTDEVGSSAFLESIWSLNRDWLANLDDPKTEDQTSGERSCDNAEVDHKNYCANSEFIISGGGGPSPDTKVSVPLASDEAYPLSTTLPEPSFIAQVATQSSTRTIRPPQLSNSKIAPSAFSPTTIAPLPPTFHYFTHSPKLNHGREFNLHSQPLAGVAVRETFVALSLLEVSEFPQDVAKQAVERETTPDAITHRTETNAWTQTELASIDPREIVHKARTAIAQATEILQVADATSLALLSQMELNDHADDPSLTPVIAATPAMVNSSPSKTPSARQMLTNRLQLGFFCLVSILLSLKSPVSVVGNEGVAQERVSSKSHRKRIRG